MLDQQRSVALRNLRLHLVAGDADFRGPPGRGMENDDLPAEHAQRREVGVVEVSLGRQVDIIGYGSGAELAQRHGKRRPIGQAHSGGLDVIAAIV